MSEDLHSVADKKFHEDVGRDDNEYSAYMAGFRSGAEYARRTPPAATAELHNWLTGDVVDMAVCGEWTEYTIPKKIMRRFLVEWAGPKT